MQIGIDRELFRKAFRKNNKGENVDAKIASEKRERMWNVT